MNINHYFDWAATAPADKDILEHSLSFSLAHWANPSSLHNAGLDARTALEETRSNIASILSVKKEHIFFTSGGTESDHIPLLSLLTRPQKGSIILSSIEHSALAEMSKSIQLCGWNVISVKPEKNGIINPDNIIKNIQPDTAFVSVMAVNNETGAIQPIYDIADKLVEYGKKGRKPFFHIDCVQAIGKTPIDLSYKGIDSASASAHKIGAARGIGLLYLAREITPFLLGGGQEKHIRSGTENLFGAKSLELALKKYFITKDNTQAWQRYKKQQELTENFVNALKEIPICTIIPKERNQENYSPWIVQAAFKGIPGQVMQRALNEKGFYISTGSACSSGRHSRPVLDSMGISKEEKESSVRFSFGTLTTEQDMKDLLETLKVVIGEL